MPVPVPALVLGGSFLAGLLLLNKREKDAAAAAAGAAAPALPPAAFSVVPAPPKAPAVVPQNLPPLPGGFIQATNIAPAPASKLSQLQTNPDGSAHTLGTPIVFPTQAAAETAVDIANRLKLMVFEVQLLQSGAKFARVTTNDPPPSGDLIMRTSPSDAGAQVPGGGAEKDGTVTILRDVDGIWSEIMWRGGTRRPLAQGFAKRKFLTILPNPVTG